MWAGLAHAILHQLVEQLPTPKLREPAASSETPAEWIDRVKTALGVAPRAFHLRRLSGDPPGLTTMYATRMF